MDTVHARRGKVSGQISGLFPDARLTLKVSQPVTPAPPISYGCCYVESHQFTRYCPVW